MSENYAHLGWHGLAEKNYRKAGAILTTLNDEYLQQVNRSFIYLSLAELKKEQNQLDSLYHYLQKARKIYKDPLLSSPADLRDKALLDIGLGEYHLLKSHTDSAMYYHQSVLHLFDETLEEDNYLKAYAYAGLGNVYDRLGKYDKAEAYLQKALARALKNKAIEDARDFYRLLKELYKKNRR